MGDRHLKPYVSGEPDIYCTHLTDDHYFIILGCDGVWDKITDDLAVQVDYFFIFFVRLLGQYLTVLFSNF